MKKRTIIVFIFCSIFLFNPNVVFAHPGRTDSSGCHKCNTNCAKWGLNSGEYHCHSGNTYKNSKGQTFNSNGNLISDSSSSNTKTSTKSNTKIKTNTSNNHNNQTIKIKQSPKSSDNTLKSIIINGEVLAISDQINYKTKNEKIDILVETNDSKATYNIDNHSLNIGMNIINIKVTAENGNVKNYSLVVNRERLSNNTGIKIIIDNEKVNFVSGKANINVSSNTKNLNYKYELEDKNSQVKVDGDKDLKYGENIVIFTVIAEDGTEVKYELKVNKYTKINGSIGVILGLQMIGGIGYLLYYFAKKQKKK